MFNFLGFIASIFSTMLVKIFFLAMFHTLTNYLFGMMKIQSTIKLLPIQNLMRVLTISLLTIYLPIVNIFSGGMVNVCSLIKMNWQLLN